MRVLVCGSRNYTDREAIRREITALHLTADSIIVHGAARGADTLAAEVAKELGLQVEAHQADWKKHGRAAGPLRNQAMLDTGINLVLAFPSEDSLGTWDMVGRARDAGVAVKVVERPRK